MTSSSEALEGIYHDMIGQQPTQANMPQEGIPTEEYMQKYGQVPTFNNVPTTTTQESDPNAWTQPGTSPAPQPSQPQNPPMTPRPNYNPPASTEADDDDDDDEEEDDDIDMSDEEEEEETEPAEYTIPQGTILYYMREKEGYKFDKNCKRNEVKGDYFYVTMSIPECICLEFWKDFYLYKYKTNEELTIPGSNAIKPKDPLYEEIEMDERARKVFIPEEKYKTFQIVDSFLLDHTMLAKTYEIKERRFARIERGLVVYSADNDIIEKPECVDDQPGCFFYVTQVLPQDIVLQDWEDKVLNVYYFNKNIVLPYGANKRRDKYFEGKYEDYVQDENGQQTLLTSYYDDTIVGKYLKNQPNTAEIFLVEDDLKRISYYSSFKIKLETVRYMHKIEKQMQD